MVWIVPVVNPAVGVMAGGICCLGSYILTCLCEQFRLCSLGQHVSKVLNQTGLFCLMTLALGGVSVYSMNFLNLAAVSIPLPPTETTPARFALIAFRVTPLGVSILISTAFAFLGLYVASRDPMFAKTKKQIIENFILDSKDMTLKEAKAISSFRMFYVISTKSLGYLVVGGLLSGSGAAVTAFLTMWSLTAPEVTFVWSIGTIIATVIFSCFFSTVSFWILFRLLSLYPRREILRVASAVFMAYCIVTTHYVGAKGIMIWYDPGKVAAMPHEPLMSQVDGFLIILVAVIIFCYLLLMVSIVDMRSWLHESSAVVLKHEAVLNKLKAMHTDNFTVISCYLRETGHDHGTNSSHGNNNNNNNESTSHIQQERSLSGPPAAASFLSKYLPIGKDRVTPRTDVSSSLPGSPSASPQGHLTPWSPRRAAAVAVEPSSCSPVFESEGAARYTGAAGTADPSDGPSTSATAALSLRLPTETESL